MGSSTDTNSIINQMEQEMNDLQQMHYSTEFSTDINSKMQIPTRLSMGQPDDIDSRRLDTDYMTSSPAHAMNVPERIMVAGSDTHVGSRQFPRHLDLDEMTPFPTADTIVALTTPPHTMKMEDVRFPTVGDQTVMKPERSSMNSQRMSNGFDDTPTGPPKLLQNSSVVEGGSTLDVRALQRHLHLLTRKVAILETNSTRRDRRELLFCTLGAIYFAYKGLRFFYLTMATQGQPSAVSGGSQNQNGTPTPTGTGTGTAAPGTRGEVNCVSLCRQGQETVQDIVAKTNEIFTVMKSMQLPNGVAPVNPQHQAKLQDFIRNIQKQFKKLRFLFDKCNQLSGGMDQSNAEELIPWKDGQDSLSDLSGLGSEEKVQVANQEKQDLVERVRSKNQLLQQVIERLRALIWDINTMMAMRHTTWP